AAAAASLLVLGGMSLGAPPDDPTARTQVNGASMLDDVVALHSAELPADVRVEERVNVAVRSAGPPEPPLRRVARYFRDKVAFPVRPAVFDGRDVRLVGARLSNVRERRAAALYYDYRGRRMTVVVTDALVGDAAGADGDVQGDSLTYRDVRGYAVPVRREAGLTYAFTGDLEREELLQLAASARVSH
ncbi:MAG: hypothetical protein AAF447_26450, partial [Myxococcota bacterium]